MAGKKSIVICITGFSKSEEESKQIRSKILALGGELSPNLETQAFCLIVNKAGSEKHRVAIQSNIPCVDIKWLENSAQQSRWLQLSDYPVPLWKGLVLTCTQLSTAEREEISHLVVSNGGDFINDLVQGKTTHLVAVERTGDKFHNAYRWKNVKICLPSWIYDCASKGEWLSEDSYKLPITQMPAPIGSSSNNNNFSSSNHGSNKNNSNNSNNNNSNSSLSKQPSSSSLSAQNDKRLTSTTSNISNKISQIHRIMNPPPPQITDAEITSQSHSTLPTIPPQNIEMEVINMIIQYKLWLTIESKCKTVLKREYILVHGFPPDINDCLIQLIYACKGRKHHALTDGTTKIMVGGNIDPKYYYACTKHAMNAPMVKISWLVETVFGDSIQNLWSSFNLKYVPKDQKKVSFLEGSKTVDKEESTSNILGGGIIDVSNVLGGASSSSSSSNCNSNSNSNNSSSNLILPKGLESNFNSNSTSLEAINTSDNAEDDNNDELKAADSIIGSKRTEESPIEAASKSSSGTAPARRKKKKEW